MTGRGAAQIPACCLRRFLLSGIYARHLHPCHHANASRGRRKNRWVHEPGAGI